MGAELTRIQAIGKQPLTWAQASGPKLELLCLLPLLSLVNEYVGKGTTWGAVNLALDAWGMDHYAKIS
jgi:hypothetical protein